jgi:hypothetical protein
MTLGIINTQLYDNQHHDTQHYKKHFDTQHNDNQHHDNQHYKKHFDTQHNDTQLYDNQHITLSTTTLIILTLSIMTF